MPITAFYAAIIAILFIVLSRRVILARRAARVAVGDGGDEILLRAMRVHANCAEYAPIALVLMALCESLAVPALVLHAFGIVLFAGRAVHAYGVSRARENFSFRVAGMGLTLTVIGMAALSALAGAVLHWLG